MGDKDSIALYSKAVAFASIAYCRWISDTPPLMAQGGGSLVKNFQSLEPLLPLLGLGGKLGAAESFEHGRSPFKVYWVNRGT